jgi:DNA-binding HxlR family transcriptional regulator
MQQNLPGSLERDILLHLLDHRGHQVRFEADQWTTEFGILRSFPGADAAVVRQSLRNLEMARWIYRRVQYVIGYSEPKLVYSLTPSGHRKASDVKRDLDHGGPGLLDASEPSGGETGGTFFNVRGVLTSDRRDLDA